jgi:hypothetical protein
MLHICGVRGVNTYIECAGQRLPVYADVVEIASIAGIATCEKGVLVWNVYTQQPCCPLWNGF